MKKKKRTINKKQDTRKYRYDGSTLSHNRCHYRYMKRKRGEIPPLEYKSLEECLLDINPCE